MTRLFDVSNYGGKTCPLDEFNLVVSVTRRPPKWAEEKQQSIWKKYGVWRELRELEHYMGKKVIRRARLTPVEVIALRLYTGPMFVLYNAKMRKFPKAFVSYPSDFITTIHCINSGILKMARVSRVPEGGFVYRGLCGIRIPDSMITPNAFGTRSGVEFGFLSTTSLKEVAMQYVGNGANPVVFEMRVGQVDHGATLSEISQVFLRKGKH